MMEDDTKKKKKVFKLFWFTTLSIFIAGILIWILYPLVLDSKQVIRPINQNINKVDTLNKKQKYSEIENSIPPDSAGNYVILSNTDDDVPWLNDPQTNKSYRKIFTGRRINIAVVGVDSRMGAGTKHADANHILSILIDSGYVDIITIPRDTPADAGYDDSTGQNKLTIVYAAKGREAYFKEAARIAGLDRIHHYAEFSFSQAMGLIELLGYHDAASTLQVLRSRTGLGGDDYQRCYNQAQFIRQMLLKHFDKLTGMFGSLLIRGGLALVKTDMSYDYVKQIVDKFNEKKFPRSPNDIIVRVKPHIGANYKVYDFTDQKTIDGLKKKIERFNLSNLEKDSTLNFVGRYNPAPRLWNAINSAVSDTAKRPQQVINKLKVLFEQRAWMQVSNLNERDRIRSQFGILLISAYNKKKQFNDAEKVRSIIEAERTLFSIPIFKNKADTIKKY
jgi:hypothetical protein